MSDTPKTITLKFMQHQCNFFKVHVWVARDEDDPTPFKVYTLLMEDASEILGVLPFGIGAGLTTTMDKWRDIKKIASVHTVDPTAEATAVARTE